MSLARFAMLCDFCGLRGEEYGAVTCCVECMAHTCPACTAIVRDEEHGRVLCRECARVCACCESPAVVIDGDPLCRDHYERHLIAEQVGAVE